MPLSATRTRILVCAFMYAATPTPSFATACAKIYEQQAFDIRVLQSELMVSALTCDMRTHYNNFITDYADILPKAGKHLKHYFLRHYGKKKGTDKLNRFVTELAGKSALNSLNQEREDYCADAESLYNVLSDRQDYLANIAALYNQDYRIDICTDRTQAILNWLYSDMRL